MKLTAAILAATLLAGCAELSRPQESSSAELITATAVVESVNQDTRQVTLRDELGGESFTVVAGEEVRNLPQLQAGDVVQFDYFQSITLDMATPDTDSAAILTGRAPEGALPGGMAVATTTLVVQLLSYDPNTALATFVTPSGETRRATVPPELRTFAAARNRGDLVSVTLTEAVAVTITETS